MRPNTPEEWKSLVDAAVIPVTVDDREVQHIH